MKALSKIFVPLLAALSLASCGGGGGGSSSAFTPPGTDTITISPGATSITTGSFTTLTVSVKKNDGSAESDGVLIGASVAPSTIGTVSGSAGQAAGTTATNTLSGGVTSFNFTSSNQVGTATITISVPTGTNGSTTTATKAINIAVTAGSTNDPRLQFTPTSLTLPLSPYSISQQLTSPFPGNFFGSPYIGEVAVQWRHSNGQLVSGGTLAVSITPTTTAGLSTLDDPTTPWSGENLTPPTTQGNEFLSIFGNGPVNATGGVATLFVHAGNVPGTATLTVTATDPDNNQTISSQLIINVAGASTSLPSSISASSPGVAYISGSNGPQSTVVSATVTDGSGAHVPDPSDGQGNGFDNVQFQIVGPSGTDARLVSVDAAGHTETGTTVSTVTHQGIANVTLQTGSQQGPVQVRATTDRGDGNVDNGIQDPVSATTTVVISDGKLFSLTLTSPGSNSPAILINRVSTEVTLLNQTTNNGTVTIPPDPNATYSFTVSVIGTDRQGNPILPGTSIKFGQIDSPVDANGVFEISGVQGDPGEGTTTFTALDGHFKTAGGGAGPGDTLLVFGKLVDGNADLESAARVTSVVNETTLHLATPFNLNDTTGHSVDYGPVLPYIVGRSQIGNITSPATTNSVGVASTTLNYPVSALGHTTAIWAQATSTDTVTGNPNLVTDISVAVYPGVAPANIVISPNPIPGNITTSVFACIYDALGSPLAGVPFTFSFDNLGVGSGTLDGINGGGTVPDLTDASGCVDTTVTTTGIAASSGTGGTTGTPQLTFSAGGASKSAPITASGGLILLANPSALGAAGGDVKLTLLNSNGTPVPGVQLTGSCTGDPSIGITSPPGTTDASGSTTTHITAALDKIGSGGAGSCTFTTATGTPTAVVTLSGVDICSLGISPTPAGCSGTGSGTEPITIIVTNSTTTAFALSSTPAALSCTVPASPPSASTCGGTLTSSTTYTLSIAPSTGFNAVWAGDCAGGSATPTTAALHCTLAITTAGP